MIRRNCIADLDSVRVPDMSNITTKRATPNMYFNYKLSLQLFKTFNMCLSESEWAELNFVETIMSGQTLFHVNKSNRLRIGLNCLCNRFHNLHDQIPLEWLNMSYLVYNIACKKKFLCIQYDHNSILVFQ